MSEHQAFPDAALAPSGLNRHAVFDLDQLPAEVRATLGEQADAAHGFRQLILLGHGGKALWDAVGQSGIGGPDPIDDYTLHTVRQWLAASLPGRRYTILYPGSQPLALQQLGKLAGWHHPSPFMLGIDREWGTWWAYRAVVLADTRFAPLPAVDRESRQISTAASHPCANCQAKPCIAACPASAMAGDTFSLQKCVAYRQQAGSACTSTCPARLACPVGSAHRYEAEQLRHTYAISLQTIREHY